MPPVKVQKIEWEQDESYPKGERWEGKVNGKLVAWVTRLDESWGGDCHYRLELGSFSSNYNNVANVESGKRAAQAAFTKVVRSLVE
jgi:L-arabinose isomerase